MSAPALRLAPEELRGLFLFERLDDEQLEWVAEHGDVVSYPAGADVAVVPAGPDELRERQATERRVAARDQWGSHPSARARTKADRA